MRINPFSLAMAWAMLCFTGLVPAAASAHGLAAAAAPPRSARGALHAPARIPGSPEVSLTPASGPAATRLTLAGRHFAPNATVTLRGSPETGAGVALSLGAARTSATGAFTARVAVPAGAAPGGYHVTATDASSGRSATAIFLVPPSMRAALPPRVAIYPHANTTNARQGVKRGVGGHGTVVVTSNIAASTTWLSTNTYQLEGSIQVNSGVTLTIQAGTKILGDSGSSLQVYGTVKAVGTATKAISFMGLTAGPGNWNGIAIRAGTSQFTYVNVSDAGEGDAPYQDAIYVGAATPSLSNLNLGGNLGVGLFLDSNSGNTTLTSINVHDTASAEYISGIFDNSPGLVTLNKCTFTNNSNYGLDVNNGGSITMTSSTVQTSGYTGIYINSGHNVSVLTSAITGNGSYGMYAGSINGIATLTGDTFTNNGLDAAALGFSSGTIRSSGNSGSGNGGYITLWGTLIGTSSLASATGIDYGILHGNYLQVNSTGTLSFVAGTAMHGYHTSGIEDYGIITAMGTAANPVVFSGSSAGAGQWYGIYKQAGGPSVYQYTTISDSGQDGYRGLYANAPISLTHVTVTNTLGAGIELDSGLTGKTIFNQVTVQNSFASNYAYGILDYMNSSSILDLESCTVSNNANYGVGVVNNGNLTVNNGAISSNSYDGISLSSVTNVIVTNVTLDSNGAYGIHGSNMYGSTTLTSDLITNSGQDATMLDLGGGALNITGVHGGGNNGYVTMYGNLNGVSTLTLLSGLDYGIAQGNYLYVNAGATLNIGAGITVHGYTGSQLVVNGVLNAIGTAASPITFSSPAALPGSWYGLDLAGGGGPHNLQYVNVSEGGRSSDESIYVNSKVQTFSHVNVSDAAGEGIYLDSGIPVGATSLTYVNVSGMTGGSYASAIFDNMSTGTTLDVETSTLDSNIAYGLRIDNGSSLIAKNDDFSNNTGTGIYGNSEANVSITNCTFNGNSSYGLDVYGISGNTTLTGNSFVNNGGDAALLGFSGGSFTAGGNSGSGNAGFITLYGNLSGTSSLAPAPGVDYGLLGGNNLQVNSAATLNVNPGVVFHGYGTSSLQGYGVLNVSGSVTNPVTFQGVNGSPGSWYGIDLHAGGPNVMQNAVIMNAGQSGSEALYSNAPIAVSNVVVTGTNGPGIYLDSGLGASRVTLTNVTVNGSSYSGGVGGIFDNMPAGSLLDVENSTLSNNYLYGIWVDNYGNLTVNNSTMSGNTYRGIYGQDITNLTVTTSTIADNGEFGIYAPNVVGAVTLTGDSFTNNGADATLFGFSNGSLTTSGLTGTGNHGYISMYGNLAGQSSLAAAPGIDYGVWHSNPLYVNTGARLTLNPGVTFHNYSQSSLQVYGTLLSQGSSGSHVTIEGYLGGTITGQWYGLFLYSSSGSSQVQYTDVLNGGQSADYGIYVNSAAHISNTSVRYSSYYGMYVDSNVVLPAMISVTLDSNAYIGLYVASGASVTFNSGTVENSGSDGVHAVSSTYDTDSSNYVNNGGWGIYGSSMVGHSVTNCTFTGNGSGSTSFS